MIFAPVNVHAQWNVLFKHTFNKIEPKDSSDDDDDDDEEVVRTVTQAEREY